MPAAGFELRTIRVAGLSRTNPLRAARACGLAAGAVVQRPPDARRAAAGRGARRRRLRRGAGRASRRSLRRVPLVLTEADSHLGITNRLLAGRARRVCLAFPIEGRDGRALSRHGPPGRRRRRAIRAAARARFGLREGETCVLVFGGSLGARTINEAAVEAFRAAPFRVLHAAGTRDFDALAPRVDGARLRPAARTSTTSATRSRPATSAWRARAARSSRSRRRASRRCSSRTRTRAPTTRRRTRAGWPTAGAAVVVADGELTAARLGREVAALLADPARLASMAAASAALARPDAAQAVADEVLAAAARRPARRRERSGRRGGEPGGGEVRAAAARRAATASRAAAASRPDHEPPRARDAGARVARPEPALRRRRRRGHERLGAHRARARRDGDGLRSCGLAVPRARPRRRDRRADRS